MQKEAENRRENQVSGHQYGHLKIALRGQVSQEFRPAKTEKVNTLYLYDLGRPLAPTATGSNRGASTVR